MHFLLRSITMWQTGYPYLIPRELLYGGKNCRPDLIMYVNGTFSVQDRNSLRLRSDVSGQL